MHSKARISALSTYENHCLEGEIDFWRPLRRLLRGRMHLDNGNNLNARLRDPPVRHRQHQAVRSGLRVEG